jgi:transposase
VRGTRVWARLLGLQRVVVEDVWIGGEGEVVVAARPNWRERDRCGICRRRCPGFDLGDGRRRWRALDLGTMLAFVEADAPRVSCRRHGVVVCAVPWARHQARFTRAFEDQVAWLAVNTSKSAVAALMRIAWRSVGGICERIAAEAQREIDLLAGLRRIGIKQLTLVSADMAAWVAGPISERCPQAELCLDPFHIVMLATDALDEIRREVWNEARRAGQTVTARDLKGARFALWKNPENLTDRQALKLAEIQKTNHKLYRAYLLKEHLRQIYRLPPDAAIRLLDGWLKWARRCRLRPFVKLARTLTDQRAGIVAAIRHGLSNARVEAINTQIRLLTRRAFGFHSPDALIALAMLSLADLCPPLPR